MVQKRCVRVTLLVEDEAIERLAREVLLGLGFHRRELFVEPYLGGQGSGKQRVTQQYPAKVKIYRSKANSQQICLLVGTDADEFTVVQRHAQLDAAIQLENLDPRSTAERIVLWIPRWNVETWLLSLSGQVVDEEDKKTKERVRQPDYQAAAVEFNRQFRIHQRGEPLVTLPSLEFAYTETQRLS
jgi:hypothetical protein